MFGYVHLNFITFARAMRVAVFFVYLCFLLLGGNSTAYAGLPLHRADNTQLRQLLKNQLILPAGARHAAGLFRDACEDPANDYFLLEEAEDEDQHYLFALKSGLLARYCLACYFSLLDDGSRSEFPDGLPPFLDHSTPKYISQRVLRI